MSTCCGRKNLSIPNVLRLTVKGYQIKELMLLIHKLAAVISYYVIISIYIATSLTTVIQGDKQKKL